MLGVILSLRKPRELVKEEVAPVQLPVWARFCARVAGRARVANPPG